MVIDDGVRMPDSLDLTPAAIHRIGNAVAKAVGGEKWLCGCGCDWEGVCRCGWMRPCAARDLAFPMAAGSRNWKVQHTTSLGETGILLLRVIQGPSMGNESF